MEGIDYDTAIAHLKKDKKLKPYIDHITLPTRNPASDVYSGLLKSIISQQLSVKVAATIHGRFLSLFDNGYPDASHLLSLSDEELRAEGLSGQKTKYVKNVAEYFTKLDLFTQDWSLLSDDEIIAILTEIKGVGKWTVQMILMFVLKRSDVFPVHDLGIQQGMQKIYKLTEEKKALLLKMEKLSTKWRPHRTVASLYLWALQDEKNKKS